MSCSPIELGKKHPGWAVTIVVAIEIIVAALIWLSGEWFYAGSVETFGPLNGYVFLWVGIGIASVAATITFFALLSTKESLELTRATQRPFLNSSEPRAGFSQSGADEGQLQYILFEITNSGIFPADGVTVQASISYDDGSDEEKVLQPIAGVPPSICFPNEEYLNVRFKDPDPERSVVKPNGTALARLLITYNSKITGEKHITRRAYRICNTSLEAYKTAPIPEDDYWD